MSTHQLVQGASVIHAMKRGLDRATCGRSMETNMPFGVPTPPTDEGMKIYPFCKRCKYEMKRLYAVDLGTE